MIKYYRKNLKKEIPMAKKQIWSMDIDGTTHTVEYTKRTLFKKAKIKIDENTYPLYSAKLFGTSEEAFRLGSEMAIISIAKNKKATLTVSGDIISEK
jgi:hypothetical protein